jgi:7-cyano-7-deazaguanine synthase
VANAIVLLSGGLDSMAAAAMLKSAGHDVSGLFIDFGQLSAERETIAAAAVASVLNVPLRTCAVPALRPADPGLLPGRNGMFVHLALHLATRSDGLVTTPYAGLIALGIHARSRYPDCGEPFVRAMQELLDLYTGGIVSISAPFLGTTKEGIWAFCLEERLPLDLTYSCELGLDQPCSRCLSCDDRRRLSATA